MEGCARRAPTGRGYMYLATISFEGVNRRELALVSGSFSISLPTPSQKLQTRPPAPPKHTTDLSLLPRSLANVPGQLPRSGHRLITHTASRPRPVCGVLLC
jgi:hypothetical protein